MSFLESESIPFKRRINYKKANSEKYREAIDKEIQNLEPTPENYKIFANKVRKISRQHIPRGCRENDETITARENLTIQLGEEKNRKYNDLIENTDMTRNSNKA
ncbi:anaphase-promoting complex subunit 1-like [Aphis craccivora]|uniref:Anaphase-promoting complex subunit 1-like n=1 Tax=Aphis craccivora TaxID=307492 RepID=A0A6G0YAD8_APHCR|nr:anaphase-promoting complex subunit 1-like [Aphis craccivora]